MTLPATAPAQIQILLVSEQAAPNLLAALDPAMKPREAVLLVSQKMVQRAQALQTVLQEVGIKTQCVALPDEHNMAALETTLPDVATQRAGQSIALNLTGGNKLMALAAQAVAQAAGWATFYVDVDTDHIIWLDKKRPAKALTQQLRLRHYLRGYGFSLAEGIERPQPRAAWQTLLQDLLLNVGTLEEPITTSCDPMPAPKLRGLRHDDGVVCNRRLTNPKRSRGLGATSTRQPRGGGGWACLLPAARRSDWMRRCRPSLRSFWAW